MHPLVVHNLYAQLLDWSLHSALAGSGLLSAGGSFVWKTVKGNRYLYYQYRRGGAQRQSYVGPSTPELLRLVGSIHNETANSRQLASMLARGGGYVLDPFASKLLSSLSLNGAFYGGSVLVGTYAFLAYQNMLGLRWTEAMTTMDVDIAREGRVELALVPGQQFDLPLVIQGMNPELCPVFDVVRATRKPVSFTSADGQNQFDLLTPLRGKGRVDPVFIHAFNAWAEPLRFLDYILDDPQPTVVVTHDMDAMMVLIPNPARFALHKMLVSVKRPASHTAKSRKDMAQARQLLEVLCEFRPHDVHEAWQALKKRGKGWTTPVMEALLNAPEAFREKMENLL